MSQNINTHISHCPHILLYFLLHYKYPWETWPDIITDLYNTIHLWTLSQPQIPSRVLKCKQAHWCDCSIKIIFQSDYRCTFRADSRFVPSQWETALLCKDVSHWLVASLESAPYIDVWLYHIPSNFDNNQINYMVPSAKKIHYTP